MEKKGKKKFFRKGKFIKNSHKINEKSLNPNVEFKKELFKDEDRPFKVDDEDYRDRARERRLEINYNSSEDNYEENLVKNKYDSIIPYQYHPGLDRELFKKTKEELEKQHNQIKQLVDPHQVESNKSELNINEKNKGKIFNSLIGSKIYDYIRGKRTKKAGDIMKIDYFLEYDLKNLDIPIKIKKNTKNLEKDLMITVHASDSVIERLEECLSKKKKRDKPKEKSDENLGGSNNHIKRNMPVDEEEEIFPDSKNLNLLKNSDSRQTNEEDDDIFKYKEVSLAELLKKK